MKVALAADHAGYIWKEKIKERFAENCDWLDLGTDSENSVNYADFGDRMGQAISEGRAEAGIMVCGSGIGISIAANRYARVRAALCTSAEMARLARQHNDANVLSLGSRIMKLDEALECVRIFLSTPFEGGRHEERVKKLNKGL